MPHVSSKKIPKDTLKRIYMLLCKGLTTRNIAQKYQRDTLHEILTHTEKVMIGKRIAAVSMLDQGMSSYKVGKMLALSPTTVAKLSADLELGKYKSTTYVCGNLRRGPLQNYLKQLLQAPPAYGTSPSSLFREK